MGELEGFVEQLLPFFHPFPSIALLPVGLLRRLGEVLVFNDLADLVTAFGRTSILCKKSRQVKFGVKLLWSWNV